LAPAPDEIFEMIRQPARAAGLTFETDPTRGIGLDAMLQSEARTEPGALPLLSFLLDELYKMDIERSGLSKFTFESMRRLGGLKGAIANGPEAAYSPLPAGVKLALPRVLRALVTISGPDAKATAQPAPLSAFPEGSASRRLVNRFLDPQIRLLVAEGDGEAA